MLKVYFVHTGTCRGQIGHQIPLELILKDIGVGKMTQWVKAIAMQCKDLNCCVSSMNWTWILGKSSMHSYSLSYLSSPSYHYF